MRLDEGVIRELHWHTEAEWAYVLAGQVRVSAVSLSVIHSGILIFGTGDSTGSGRRKLHG